MNCCETYSSTAPMTFAEMQNFKAKVSIELDNVRAQVNAQEHTINHTQTSIEKCLEKIEKVEELADVEKIKSLLYSGVQTHASILRCEADLKKVKHCLGDIWDRKEKIRIHENNDQVINPFEFIAVDAKRRDDIRHIKNSLYELYTWIVANVQDNKERSKGIERLEEAAMWLNKSISRRKGNET